MATITLSFGATSYAKTISAAHLNRSLAAERSLRNMPEATDDQITAEMAKDFFSLMKSRVRQVENRDARAAASASVTDITINGA